MYFKVIPFLLTLVEANPTFIGTPQILEHAFTGGEIFHHLQPSSLINSHSNLLTKYGGLEKMANPKTLLASQVHKSGLSFPMVHPATSLAFAAPLIHHMSYPLKEMELPLKITAGALVKGVPKMSKLPINVAYSPKALELASLGHSLSHSSLLGAGHSIASMPFIHSLGVPYGF